MKQIMGSMTPKMIRMRIRKRKRPLDLIIRVHIAEFTTKNTLKISWIARSAPHPWSLKFATVVKAGTMLTSDDQLMFAC